MSTPLSQQLETALADLRVQQTRIKAASEQLSKATGTATSKDRAIEATVDSRGKLTALSLKGTGYRKLAPAELAARIVETVRSAQDAVSSQAAEMLTGLMPAGLGLDMGPTGLADGSWDIDSMFEAAARAVQEPLLGDGATDRGTGAGHG
jgi:DNA-binding protein YbaB